MTPIPKRILIIEDDRNIAELIMIRLELSGYRTHWARNGNAGLAAITDFKPDAILLDIGLPDRDGFDVLQTLRSVQQTKDLPILMITARDAAHDVKRSIALGANDYLVKPFDDRSLCTRVERALRNKQVTFKNEKTLLL